MSCSMLLLQPTDNIAYAVENETLKHINIKSKNFIIPDKEIDVRNITDNSIILSEIPQLRLTEINKEIESENEYTAQAEQNYPNRLLTKEFESDNVSEIPRINKKWLGLDIYTAMESKEVNSSIPNVRAINPPDVTLGVGKHHVVQLVHSAIQIWNKTGESLKKVELHDFFNISKRNYITDPSVVYDKSSDRWYATIVDGGREKMENGSSFPTCLPIGCKVIVAVSDHETPMGTWSVYPINASEFGYFPDLPKISLSRFNLMVTTKEFEVYPVWNESKSRFWTYMIDKSQFSRSDPVVKIQYMDPVIPEFPILFLDPTKCSSTATLYKIQTHSTVSKLSITDYCNPNDIGNYVSRDIQIPTLYPAPVFKQPFLNETDKDKNDKYELTILSAWRNDTTMWIALHSACQPSSISENSCINILRIDKTPRTGNFRSTYGYELTDFTQFHINQTDVYYPAIGISKDGKLFFISGFSNSTIFPSLMVSYLASENKTQDRFLIFGSNINNSTIYGDYFGSAIDPVDGSVWVSGQYVDDSIPVPPNIPPEELRRTQNKTWSTIVANIS